MSLTIEREIKAEILRENMEGNEISESYSVLHDRQIGSVSH